MFFFDPIFVYKTYQQKGKTILLNIKELEVNSKVLIQMAIDLIKKICQLNKHKYTKSAKM